MLKRTICFLLSLVMLLGILPPMTLQARAESENLKDFFISWLEDGTEKTWSYTSGDDASALPAGVSFTEGTDALTVTLNGANLTQLILRDWGSMAVKILVEGTNTISHTGTGEALRIDCCHDTTISGSGTLKLSSEDEPLYWHDYYWQSGGTGTNTEHPDGKLTISGVTIDAYSDHESWSQNRERTEWDSNPILFMGGYVNITDHAVIQATGMGPAIVETKLTVEEGASFTGSGMSVSVRENVASENTEDFVSSLTINEGSSVSLRYPEDCGYSTHLLLIGAHCQLTVNGGTLTVDNSDTQVSRIPIYISAIEGAFNDSGTATIQGGTVKVFSGNIAYAGISMGNGAKYNQSGGDVQVSVPCGIGVDIGREADFTLSGGTMQITGTDHDPADGSEKIGLHVTRKANATVSNGASLNTSGSLDADVLVDGSLLFSGGTFTGKRISVWSAASMQILGGSNITAGELNPCWGGTVHMLDGTLKIDVLTAQNGYVRFSGGETTIAEQVQVLGNPEDFLSYGEGIQPADENGTRMNLLTDDGDFWYTDGSSAVTIKNQNTSADTGSVLLEMMNANTLTAGTVEYLRMAVGMTSAEGNAVLTLPQGMELVPGAVSVNGLFAEYSQSGNQITVPVRNGDVIRFGITATSVGEKNVLGNAGGASANLTVRVTDYTLALPNTVNEPSIPVSGTTVPGAKVAFYVDGVQKQTTTANEMGMWAAELELEEGAKAYQVYAQITIDGDTVNTAMQEVTYNAALPVVESLTFTNTIHGETAADPNRDVSVTINYKERTRSQSYYTYWPELPTFTFKVKFEDNAGTPDTVSDVNVVATDYFGVEEEVPTEYDAATGLWVGTAEFCGDDDIVPEQFRVEWLLVGENSGSSGSVESTPALDELEPLIPESVEENHADTAIVTAESNTYTFDLSSGASGLQVTDSKGNQVAVTGNSFTGESGVIYYATLTNGTFEGYDTQEICVLMPATGNSSFTYAPNVYETKRAGLKVDDIYIDGDAAYKITAVNADGSYVTETPFLEEVFEELNMDGLSLPEDGEPIVLEEELAAAAAEAFPQTNVYAAYMQALADFQEEEDMTMASQPEWSFGVTLGEYQEYQGQYLLPITVKTSSKAEMTANLPVVGEVPTEVYSEFEYKYQIILDMRVQMDTFKFQSMAFTVDETHTMKMEMGVKVNGQEDDEKVSSLKLFFNDAMEDSEKELYLEGFDEPPVEDATILPMGSFKIRTNIPVLWIAVKLDMEFTNTASGDLTFNTEATFGQKYGFTVDRTGDFDIFYEEKPFTATTSVEMHISAEASAYLKASCGPELLNLVNLYLEGRTGPSFKMNGHGQVTFSSDPENNGAELTFWAGLTMDFKIDLAGEAWLGKYYRASMNLFTCSTPIVFVGSDFMPTRFTTREEEPVQVYDDCKLEDVIDLSMDYQRFSNGLQTGSKVMEMKDYTIKADYSGKFTVEGTTLKLNDPTTEIKNSWVEVTYKSEDGGYEVKKQVPIEYHPAQIQIVKTTDEGGSRVAGFLISGEDGFRKQVSTSAGGVAVVPVESNKSYNVTEVSCPGGYFCANPVQSVTVQEEPKSVSFYNQKDKEPEEPHTTQDVPIESGGDPSGYVYEGIESNRLSGVTATVYRSDSPDGSGAVEWNAEAYDQVNPQSTDVLGQYLWMVPSGYYQVRYSKEGYTSAQSEWMVVPPVRTNVNQNLTSTAAAEMDATFSEELGCVVLRFSRPVLVGDLSHNLQVTMGEEFLGANLSPVNAGWSVMENPADSQLCATTFLLFLPEGIYEQAVTIGVTSTTYAGTVAQNQDTVRVTTPAGGNAYYVEISGGNGSGSYDAGSTVSVDAVIPEGMLFDRWITEGIQLEDETVCSVNFTMPNHNVKLIATYKSEPVTYLVTVTGGSGSGDYEAGQMVRVVAGTPQEGMAFDQWEITGIVLNEGEKTSASLGFEMPANAVTLNATYKEKTQTYQLVVENGYGFGTYEPGTLVDVTAYPAKNGMYFSHWEAEGIVLSDDDTQTAAVTIQMPENEVTLEAVYKDIPTLKVTGGSILSPDDSGSYLPGTKVTVTAQIPEGKEFDCWTAENITLHDTEKTSATVTITMPEQDASLTAVFKDPPVAHSLTVTGGSGSGSYNAGTEVTVAAQIPEGKEFDHWEANGIQLTAEQSGTPAITITMPDGDVSLSAVLRDIPVFYKLTVAGGTITAPDASGTYTAGTEVHITADVPEGMLFDAWTAVNIELSQEQKTSQTITIVMPKQDVSLEAVCKARPVLYSVTVAGGSGSGSYEKDTQVTVAAQVPTGMVFHQWTAQGMDLTDVTAPEITFTMPEAAVVLAASYLPKNALQQLHVIGGSGSGAYEKGAKVTVTADVPEGMRFVAWTAEGLALENRTVTELTVTMPENAVTLTADYEADTQPPEENNVTVAGGSGSGNYEAGAEVTVTADIPEGMEFSHWETDSIQLTDSASQEITFVCPADGTVTITAVYKPKAAGYLATVAGGSGSGVYQTGGQVHATADIPVGMVFAGWGAEGITLADAAAETAVFTMPENPVTLVAAFRPAQNLGLTYTLSVAGGSGSGSYQSGARVVVTADVPQGMRFKQWDALGMTLSGTDAVTTPLTVTMPAAPVSLTAVFESEPVPVTYPLEVTYGTITAPNASGSYAEGTRITVRAENRENYHFQRWIVSGIALEDETASEFSFVMPANRVTLTAAYEAMPASYELTVVDGTITAPDASGSYQAGTTVTVRADEKEGHAFKQWAASGITLTNAAASEVRFTMPENEVTLIAVYEEIPVLYKVTVTGGAVTAPDASGSYEAGESITVKAETRENYVFKEWMVSGITLTDTTSSEVQFVMPQQDVTLTAVFEEEQEPEPVKYKLTVTNGYGSGSYQAGTLVTVRAATKSGYTFREWKVSGVSLSSKTSKKVTFTMPKNSVTLEALYDKNSTSDAADPHPTVPSGSQSSGQTSTTVNTYKVKVTGGTGEGEYLKGQRVYVTAEVPERKEFDYWKVRGIELEDNNDPSINFLMPAKSVTLEAVFKDKGDAADPVETTPKEDAPKKETQTNPYNSALESYQPGENVTLKAETKEGFRFSKWNLTGIQVADETSEEISFTIPEGEVSVEAVYLPERVVRIAGKTAYDTSFAIAEVIKEQFQVEKFNAVVITSGEDYEDALSAAYLAYVKKAPVLLVDGDNADELKAFLTEKLSKDGIVYLLGRRNGEVQRFASDLGNFEYKALTGEDQYEINLAVLRETGITGETLLVCTGRSYADALSASAAGRPILLVDKELTEQQTALLESIESEIVIVGGKHAVSMELQETLGTYSTVSRISGKNKYETSVKVAQYFFPDADSVIVANAGKYTDGICGSVLAARMGVPMILASRISKAAAVEYMERNGITAGFVLGGSFRFRDSHIKKIFALNKAETIAEW